MADLLPCEGGADELLTQSVELQVSIFGEDATFIRVFFL